MTASCVLALLEEAAPDPRDPAGWARWADLSPHVRAATDHAHARSADREVAARLLGNHGIYLETRGEYTEAEATQTRALAIFEAVYGPDHPEVAITLGNSGIVQAQLGRLEEAEATQSRALAVLRIKLGPQHPHTRQANTHLESVRTARIE